jgi:HEPN domain-containing protein
MNVQASREWLIKSWHNLSTAQLLYGVNHYTDIIAVNLHYSCEKTLKSILAYQNRKSQKHMIW